MIFTPLILFSILPIVFNQDDNNILSKLTKRLNDGLLETNHIQDLTNNSKSIAYLPIAEIIRRVNLTHLVNRTIGQVDDGHIERKIDRKKEGSFQYDKYQTIKLLMTGSDEEIMQIPYEMIMTNMKMIGSMSLPKRRKMAVWEIVSSKIPIESMSSMFLNQLNDIWNELPEYQLVQFNVKKGDILHFFGTSKQLKRRQAAILAYVIKQNYGSVLENVLYINKIQGLLCGFSETDLIKIRNDVFKDINPEVFLNLWPCTLEQLQVLLKIAQNPDAYGPLEIWNKETIKRLGLLVSIIDPIDFKRFDSNVLAGLESEILDVMSNEQLFQFTEAQVRNLNDNVLMSYNLRMSNYKVYSSCDTLRKVQYLWCYSIIYMCKILCG